MKEIPLAKGDGIALVDDDDYERLCGSKWWKLRTKSGKEYAYRPARRADGGHTSVLMHRVIMGARPRQLIDHVDGNGLNNQKTNLRACNDSQNNANKKKIKGFSSQFKGVSLNKEKRKWQAFVKKDGKSKFLGYFSNEVDAAKAYDLEAWKIFGEFAQLNFPVQK